MFLPRTCALFSGVVVAGYLGFAGPSAAVVMQLEVTGTPGIPGESIDAKHPGSIDLQSFSFGAQIPYSTTGSGGASGKVNFNALTVTKWIDKSTPTLFLDCASGLHLSKATLYVRPANSTTDTFKILLQDVVITSVTNGGTVGGDRPTETLSIAFGKIQWFYQALDANGAPSGVAVVAGWDVTQNKRL